MLLFVVVHLLRFELSMLDQYPCTAPTQGMPKVPPKGVEIDPLKPPPKSLKVSFFCLLVVSPGPLSWKRKVNRVSGKVR